MLPQLLYLSSMCWQKNLPPGNVYFHIAILVNRSVQLVARNHECPKEINNVPCVVWSCIKMHATHEIVNYASRFNHSCNKLHATYEIMNYVSRLIIRAISCTLRMKSWITYRGELFVQQVARYAWNRELHIEVNYSCNKLHATYEIVNYVSRWIIRATSYTLRTKS